MYPGMNMGMGMPMGMGMANPMGMGPMNPSMAMGLMGMPLPLMPGKSHHTMPYIEETYVAICDIHD